MSIKSQKSLNDECSEIIEKSYSVKSASDDSLSCSDDEECLARELIHKLTPAAVSRLRRCFKKPKGRSNDIDRRVEEVMRQAAAEEGIEFAVTPTPPRALCLDEPGFITAVRNIFGHTKYTPHAHQLFQSMDPFSSGRVWWRQVVARLVAAGARKTCSRVERWKPVTEGGIKTLDHCKRETIVKLVSIEQEDSFCYAAVSKGGRIGIYSGELKLLNSYEMFYHRTGLHRRVKNCWITDAIYLNDVQCLMLSASDRSLTVYDVTTLTHTPLYCITGLPNIPTSLAYQAARQLGNPSDLIFGNERGDLTRVRFLQPRISLFHTNTPENINYYFWMELTTPSHSSYCSISTWRKVHSRTVRRVSMARDGDIVISCSHDTAISVRARHLPGKLDDYVFKVQRGVSCFHVVTSLHLLACGSSDGIVRLWDTTQASPFANLSIPTSPAVLDVAVIAAEEIIVAYCSNCSIHIWDLYEECLLQSVKIKFPFLGVLGKRVEFGTYCIHPGPSRKSPKEVQQNEESLMLSRRGSSVCRGSTGGLTLLPEPQKNTWERGLEQEPEYIRFNRCELLITCCDTVFTLILRVPEGTVLPPPGNTLRARRPSHWELPSDLLAPVQPASTPRPSPRPSPRAPRLLAPETAEHPPQDVEELLRNAGLQGILEKDFVLMQGLKHDLNRKIYEMESNMETTKAAVSAGAPYLALRSFDPDPLPSFDHLAEQCARVMRLFPGPSVAATPSGSDTSTPRQNKIFRL